MSVSCSQQRLEFYASCFVIIPFSSWEGAKTIFGNLIKASPPTDTPSSFFRLDVMALSLISLLSQPPVFLILFATSMFVLSCVIIVVVAWRMALILWCHHITTGSNSSTLTATTFQSSLSNQGLDRKSLLSLPRIAYDTSVDVKLTECAICLMEFVEGEAMRVLPHCGHGFHVKCIDRWLQCHSSCPFCRHILAMGSCQNCAGL